MNTLAATYSHCRFEHGRMIPAHRALRRARELLESGKRLSIAEFAASNL